jgi:predicted  nucleic acid-binding Zn-ribbon protein
MIKEIKRMTLNPFEQFIALVHVDQKINTLQASINKIDKEREQRAQGDLAHKNILSISREKVHAAKKEVDAQELEMKILDEKEREKKNNLERIANYKEYQSLKAEVDAVKTAQHNLEEGLIGAWNRLDLAKKEYEVAQQTYQNQHAEYEQAIAQDLSSIEQKRQEIQELLTQRVEKEKSVPAEWLEKYAIMRTRTTDPVVPVIKGSCSACFLTVSHQDMQALERHKLIQCKDCFRLLYLPDGMQQQS